MKVLIELRPALDGHAGIPQEARLLFRGLGMLEGVEVEGLLQSSNRVIAGGLPAGGDERWSEHRRVNRLSRVVVSLQPEPKQTRWQRLAAAVRLVLQPAVMVAATIVGRKQHLGRFDATRFRDFVWRALFAKTLPPSDFDAVTSAGFRVLRMPWSALHATALVLRRLGHALYPRLDTRGVDVVIAETPWPARVSGDTRLVVRYHDAIPILMPHTISDKAYHQASHFHALRRNVEDGAWFACVSDSTRHDLISIFPQAAARALTVYNMVSHHYHPTASDPVRIAEIVNTRRNVKVKGGGGRRMSATAEPFYLLMVSTIEPRKNHVGLIAAWEQIRTECWPDLELVLVGSLGWDHKGILRRLRPWLERGGLHLLEDVPANELRQLYQHAQATACPSFGEGFDFSGVEAMRCDGAVIASDIPVHREVYGDAAEFFSPYSTGDMANAIRAVVGPPGAERRQALTERGRTVSARYLPERVLPEWQAFLDQVRR